MTGAILGLMAAVLLGGVAWWAVVSKARRPLEVARSAGDVDHAVPVRDLEHAADWVNRRLPAEIGRALTREDVRRIIAWNLEYFRSRTASGNGHSPHGGGQVLVAGAETVDYVLARADGEGIAYTSAQVHAVLDVQMTYLRSMGAMVGDDRGGQPDAGGR